MKNRPSVSVAPSLVRRAVVGLSLAALAGGVLAQDWKPNRPITMIVPWGAGGGTDATARILASIMEKDLGQPVNVVNRTGGSGVVGCRRRKENCFWLGNNRCC